MNFIILINNLIFIFIFRTRNITLFLLFIITTVSVLGQQEQKLSSFNIEGQIAATTDGKGVFINFGGPTVKFNFSKITLGINFLSIFYNAKTKFS